MAPRMHAFVAGGVEVERVECALGVAAGGVGVVGPGGVEGAGVEVEAETAITVADVRVGRRDVGEEFMSAYLTRSPGFRADRRLRSACSVELRPLS